MISSSRHPLKNIEAYQTVTLLEHTLCLYKNNLLVPLQNPSAGRNIAQIRGEHDFYSNYAFINVIWLY